MTPIVRVELPQLRNRLYIKREDLFPFSFGGNKARIAREFLADMKRQGKDCLVGYGNARSNLSRVLANLCQAEGIPCVIVSPADEDGTRVETFNQQLAEACGASFVTCGKTEVADTVGRVLRECETRGLRPYYIYGNRYGKGNEDVPLHAYRKVYDEIAEQSRAMGVGFDRIFLAVGTGMTQAGLLLGKCLRGGRESVVGISVARSRERVEASIAEQLDAFRRQNSAFPADACEVLVDDAFLAGGYGCSNEGIDAVITTFYTRCGIPLDPTYTGKAMWGTLSYLERRGAPGKCGDEPGKVCRDCAALLAFLERMDALLPTPLTGRVSLSGYLDKILSRGTVLVRESDGAVVGAVFFYCNDTDTGRAYISFLGVLPERQNEGLATRLLADAERASAAAGMTAVCLETDFANSRAIALYGKRGYRVEFADQKLHFIKEIHP